MLNIELYYFCRLMARVLKEFKQNFSEVYKPRIVVICSPDALNTFHVNYLTPAELFSPFDRTNTEHRIKVNYKESIYKPMNGFSVKFQDIEECDVTQSDYITDEIKQDLKNFQPKIEQVQKLDYNLTKFEEKEMLLNQVDNKYFNQVMQRFMLTYISEDPVSILNKPVSYLTIIDSNERDYIESYQTLYKKHSSKLQELLQKGSFNINSSLPKVVLITVDLQRKQNYSDQQIESKLYEFKQKFKNCLVECIKLNKNVQPSYFNETRYAPYLKPKRHLAAYDMGDEKVDVKTPNLSYGRFLSKTDTDNIEKFVSNMIDNYLIQQLEKQLIHEELDVIEKKKSIKKGFFGLFKKEEQSIYKENKLVLSEAEFSIKQYGELLMMLKQYELAGSEFKVLIEEVKKKCIYSYIKFMEIKICSMLMSLNPTFPKKEVKELESTITEAHLLLDEKMVYKHRLPRLTYYMHIITYIKLTVGDRNALIYGQKIADTASFFSNQERDKELFYLFPILKEQTAYYYILGPQPQVKKFCHLLVVSAYLFYKQNLLAYSAAGYQIAKFQYQRSILGFWGLIVETSFYNLGGILQKFKMLPESLKCYIQTLNSYQSFPDKEQKVERILKKIIPIVQDQISQGEETQNMTENIVRENIKVIQVNNWNLQLPEDQYCNQFGNLRGTLIKSKLMKNKPRPRPISQFKRLHQYSTQQGLLSIQEQQNLRLLTCNNSYDKKDFIGLNIREVDKSQQITLELKIRNKLMVELKNEIIQTIYLDISYNESQEQKYYFQNEDKVRSPELLESLIEVQIDETSIPANEEDLLLVKIRFHKTGFYKLDKLKYEFLGITYSESLGPNSHKANQLRVVNNRPRVEVKTVNAPQQILFGEVSSFFLQIKNESSADIEQIDLISCDYLFTGFTKKTIEETVLPGEKQSFDIQIRGTQLDKNKQVPLLVLLKQNGIYTYRVILIEMEITDSFQIKCYTNDIGYDRKFITFDLIKQKTNPYLEDIYFRDVLLISNAWEIEEDSIQRIQDGQVKLLNLIIRLKSGFREEAEEAQRIRKNRNVILSDQMVRYEETPSVREEVIQKNLGINKIIQFLKQENKQFRDDEYTNYMKCKDMIEFAITWVGTYQASGRRTLMGFNSVTGIFLKGMPREIKALLANNDQRVAVHVSGPSSLRNDFSKVPVVQQEYIVDVKFKTNENIRGFTLQLLNSYQKVDYHGVIQNNCQQQQLLHYWTGKTKYFYEEPLDERYSFKVTANFPQTGVYDIFNLVLKDSNGKMMSITPAFQEKQVVVENAN